MKRKKGRLQSSALAALAASDKPLAAGEVLDAMGLHKTPVTRAALSRALRRLAMKGHVHRIVPDVAISGGGYLYALRNE